MMICSDEKTKPNQILHLHVAQSVEEYTILKMHHCSMLFVSGDFFVNPPLANCDLSVPLFLFGCEVVQPYAF